MSRLAVVACWLAVAVRVVLVLGLIAISIAFATHPAGTWDWRTWDWMYDIVLGVFILPMLVYIALAFTLRCPSCRRCFLVERGKKHPASRKMDIWVTGAPLCATFSASANSRACTAARRAGCVDGERRTLIATPRHRAHDF